MLPKQLDLLVVVRHQLGLELLACSSLLECSVLFVFFIPCDRFPRKRKTTKTTEMSILEKADVDSEELPEERISSDETCTAPDDKKLSSVSSPSSDELYEDYEECEKAKPTQEEEDPENFLLDPQNDEIDSNVVDVETETDSDTPITAEPSGFLYLYSMTIFYTCNAIRLAVIVGDYQHPSVNINSLFVPLAWLFNFASYGCLGCIHNQYILLIDERKLGFEVFGQQSSAVFLVFGFFPSI